MGEQISFKVFDERFRNVNKNYRRGLFEARLDPETFELLDQSPPHAISLEEAALELARTAIDRLAFVGSEVVIPSFGQERISTEIFKTYARSIVNAYELTDYFLRDSKMFDPFLNGILALLLKRASDDILSTVNALVKGHVAEPELPKIGDEFLLLALCAVNSVYRGGTNKFDEGCKVLVTLERMIVELGHAKHHKSFGLLGLHRYLRGRLQFGLGRLKEAEESFAESAHFYSQRIKIRSTSEIKSPNEIEEARILSLRRATLARCLGTAYLFYVQSRLERSVELLRIGVPILTLDCGRVNTAYCELIEVMATRALHADNDEKLINCEQQVQASLGVFEEYVPHGHYMPRGLLELARIKDCRAKQAFDQDRWEDSQNLFQEIESLLNRVVGLVPDIDNTRHRAILAGAFILRSQISRHRLRMHYKKKALPLNASDRVAECISDAQVALDYATSKQQRCEALLTLGQARLFSNTVAFEELKMSPIEMRAAHESVLAQYSEALSENGGENPRITAIALLGLTELEMTASGNYYYAKRYFERFESVVLQIEDRKCRLFAENLRSQLDRPHTDFFVDPNSKEGLNPRHWHNKLNAFLREQVMYQTARKFRGKLDLPDQKKGAKSNDDRENQSTNDVAPKKGKQTRQSILTKSLSEELKISRAAASTLARDLLPDFKRIIDEEELLAKILNSPD